MINYLTIKNRLLVAMLAFILPFSFAKAEVKEDGKAISHGWYVGIEGGMPFGFSTFSSFGYDKTHLGWAAGLYGGYRFNSIFSIILPQNRTGSARKINPIKTLSEHGQQLKKKVFSGFQGQSSLGSAKRTDDAAGA